MGIVFRRLTGALLLSLSLASGPVAASDDAATLSDVLLLPEVVDVLRSEGLKYGKSVDDDVLNGTGGAYFATKVSKLYDRSAMLTVLNRNLASEMKPEDIAQSLAFFDTELGHRILRLELSAREAMADPAVDEIAGAAFAEAKTSKKERAAAITRFIEINDLSERNVAGALSSNYQFFVGMVTGGSTKMSEAEIIDEVWSQEDDIRADTESWLTSFLYLAYGPLSDDEMNAYLDYSATPAGQALNAALFAGFDEMYSTIYYALGLAAAQAMGASDL